MSVLSFNGISRRYGAIQALKEVSFEVPGGSVFGSHVAILKQGALLAAGPTAEILSAEDTVEIGAADLARLEAVLGLWPGVKSLRRHDGQFHAVPDAGNTAEQLNRYCGERGVFISHLVKRSMNLEARFMELTQ